MVCSNDQLLSSPNVLIFEEKPWTWVKCKWVKYGHFFEVNIPSDVYFLGFQKITKLKSDQQNYKDKVMAIIATTATILMCTLYIDLTSY